MKKKSKATKSKISKRKISKVLKSKLKRKVSKSSKRNPPGYSKHGMWYECHYCGDSARSIDDIKHKSNCPRLFPKLSRSRIQNPPKKSCPYCNGKLISRTCIKCGPV